MDRKLNPAQLFQGSLVALRKESVDRKTLSKNPVIGINVALRKESVDRKKYKSDLSLTEAKSLSARRAWIEKLE